MREGSQVAQQQTLRTYAVTLEHSYQVKRRGKPALKARRKTLPSLQYTTRGFVIRNNQLKLPRGVSIPVVWSRELPSDPKSVNVYKDSLGHWYASFVVRRDIEPSPDATETIGIDWGVATTATTATTTNSGYDLPYGGYRKRCAAELARAQRKMCRRRRVRGQTPSNGYQRARLTTAKLHKKAQRQNTHTARVWAARVVAGHQLIAVEDFRSRFLAKSTMARKAADAAIFTTKRELIERATRAGRRVVMVKPAYTTMTCCQCFARAKQRLELAERTFLCCECGYTDTRDGNAARVILAVAERDHTSVDDVRHGPDHLRVLSSRAV